MRDVLDERGVSPLSPSLNLHSAASATRRQSTTLTQLVHKWATERKPDRGTVGIANKVIGRFEQLVGRLNAEQLTRRHVVQFKDKLLAAGQTPVNTDKQLVMLGTLLNFAAANLLIDQNPAKGVRVGERRNAREERLPFDLQALQAIFASPVYSEGQRPRGGAGGAAYWLPLLAPFTGARVEEVGQLRPEDVYKESYHDEHGHPKDVWVLRITDEGQGQSLKNARSRRRFPVHPSLLQLGFAEFAQAQVGRRESSTNYRPTSMSVKQRTGRQTTRTQAISCHALRRCCVVAKRTLCFQLVPCVNISYIPMFSSLPPRPKGAVPSTRHPFECQRHPTYSFGLLSTTLVTSLELLGLSFPWSA